MSLLARLQSLFHRRQVDDTVDDELRFHLEKEIEQNIRRGLSPSEARRQALISFGGVQQTREAVRDVRWAGFLEILYLDVRYALRMLRKSPGFTTVAVITLTLGIGMNTAIFSLINAVIFRSLPVRDQDGLVVLKWEAHEEPTTQGYGSFGACNDNLEKTPPTSCSLPLPLLKDLQAQTNVFSHLAAFTGYGQMDLGGNGPAKRVHGAFVSGGYFATLEVEPAAGRMLSDADDRPEAAPVALLSYKFWQSDFGGSPSVVGRTVRLNNKPYTIVGVAEQSFTALTMTTNYDLWVPLWQQRNLRAHWIPLQEGMSVFEVAMLGRLKPNMSLSQAEAAASVVFRNATLLADKPPFKAEDDPHIRLMAARKELRGRYNVVLGPVYVLLVCVGIILLIACANIAGLLVARAAGREREIAVRLALGAKRARLFAQLLVESLTLALMGGVLGLLVALWGARVLMVLLFSGQEQPPTFSPHLDWRVLLFTAGVSLLTGVVFGMAPAFRALQLDLTPSLKADASGGAGMPRRRFGMGRLLVTIQVALAVLLLTTAGLFVRTLANLKNVNPGFDASNVLLFGLDPRFAGYKGPQVSHLYQELQGKFSALPSVKSVSYSWTPLLSGGYTRTTFHRPGTPVDSNDRVSVETLGVGPNFLATLRIPLLAGRDLSETDFAAAALTSPLQPRKVPTPVVVNQFFVRTYFPGRNPLGQVFGDGLAEDPSPAFPGYQIVGVVGDTKYRDLRQGINPTFYSPTGNDGGAFYELRTAANPLSLIPAVRNTVNRVDDNLVMFRIDTQKGQIDRQLSGDRMLAQLSSFFALLALLLACTGIYGLLSYEVTRRTREIGIRMAIGAQQKDVVGMVLRQGMLLALAGAVIGAGTSFAVSGLVKSILYGVHAGDPLTLAVVTVILVAIASVACYLPARRATRVDPLVALRYE